MIESQHIKREDLLELLGSDTESEKTRAIGEHLHQCTSCRARLDELSARSEIWEKTPELLKDKPDTSIFERMPSLEQETSEHRLNNPANTSDHSYNFPIEGILDPPMHPEMIGRIGKYDIEREVGRGGMGIVFKAHDSELNRPLAIKVLAPHLACHGTARKRFAQEARAAAGVLHPNVIGVYDVNNEGKTPYFVMPYVAGSSLQKLIDEKGPLPEIEIVRVALQIAAGLVPAHSQGLVHRDIKPANILVEQNVNRVIITDFGLARAEDDASLTRTGWLTGTPNYMSPEQTRGERLDQRSDLFSLGSLIYFLATGRLPFRAESPLGVLTRIQNETPTPVRQVNNQISKTLSEVIEVLLRKDPESRFQSAGDLHELLERHLAYLHQPDISKPPQVLPSPSNARKRSWIVFGAIAASILLGSAASMLLDGWFDQGPEIAHKTNGEFDGSGNPSASSEFNSPAGILPYQQEDDEDEKDNNEDDEDEKDNNEEDGDEEDSNEDSEEYSLDQDDYEVISSGPSYRRFNEGQRLFNEAYKLYEEKKFDDAIAKFKEAAKYDRYQQKSIYNIGCIWALRGEYEKAFDFLNQSVDLHFADIDQFENDSDLDSLREDKRYEELIERVENLHQAYELIVKARSHCADEDYAEGEALCRQALQLDPENEKAAVNLGYALHMQGKLSEAIQWHQMAAASKSYAAIGNYNMCCVHSIRNETEKAFEYMEKALDAGLVRQLNKEYLEDDSDLDNIRDDERFKKVLEEVDDLHTRISGMHFHIHNGGIQFQQMVSSDLGDVEEISGEWKCRLVGEDVELTIMQSTEDDTWSWGYSSTFTSDDFSPPVTKHSKEFRLDREYGSLVFNGEFSGRKGEGEFHFEGKEKYQTWLDDRGIEEAPNAVLYRLFMSWQDEEEIVSNLIELQELDLDKETTSKLMIHGVGAELVKSYQKADLPVEKNLLFIVWRVGPSLIQAYNKADLDPHEHEIYINKRIQPKLLLKYKDAGFDLETHQTFLDWRVEPRFLESYQSAGLSLEEHKRFIQHRVPSKLLNKYIDAEFDIDKLERFICAQVDVDLIKDYQRADMLTDSYEYFIQCRVPAELVLNYQKAGFDPQDHKYFLQHQVPAKLLQAYESAGMDIQEHRKLIQRRMEPDAARRHLDQEKEKN